MINFKLCMYILANCIITATIFISCVVFAVLIAWSPIVTRIVEEEVAKQNGLGFLWVVFVFFPCAFIGFLGSLEYFIYAFGNEIDSEVLKKFKKSIKI